MQIIKKDNTFQDYDEQKIINACNLAAKRALFSFDTWVSKYSYNMFIMELSENKLQIGKMEVYFGNMFPFNIVMLLWH